MTITTNTLGPNSVEFQYGAGDTPTAIIAQISAWLPSHGWTSYDAANNVFTALCADGVTAKYIQLYSSTTTNLMIRVYELWNASTHVGTNETTYSVVASATSGSTTATALTVFTISASGGYVDVFATNRYALMYTKSNANFLAVNPHGCVEWTTNTVDTNGVPFGWIYSVSLLGNYLYMSTGVASFQSLSPARSYGVTGNTTLQQIGMQAGSYQTVLGYPNHATSSGSLGISLASQLPIINDTTTNLPQSYTLDVVKFNTVLTTNVNIINTPATFGFFIPQALLGRIYGVKIIAGNVASWAPGDTCTLAVDSNYFQVSSGGTVTTHYTVAANSVTTQRLAIPL